MPRPSARRCGPRSRPTGVPCAGPARARERPLLPGTEPHGPRARAARAGRPRRGLRGRDAQRGAREPAGTSRATDPDFWSQVGLVELDLCTAPAEGRLAAAAGDPASSWADLHGRVASPGWWGSVADQADLLLGALLRHGPAGEREAAAWPVAATARLCRQGGKGDRAPDRRTRRRPGSAGDSGVSPRPTSPCVAHAATSCCMP
ncbi:MAG: hypothetical protein MZW92_66225 [Comamonadaceae bacterium]|nr:hypothetical protein [Comamonadaceae bacterium]